ncbi:MFS transporter [Gorillibacterium sp. CAU 1737]|uniref:MFS transporter n=1 Tax=Gorillibacterium sp. CAU 1737 TaxID=3140362 RepID=UPI0032615465
MDPSYRCLRQNIRRNLNMGIASTSSINFTVPFFPVIAARFGATNTDYALLNSIPALLTILSTLPASAIIARFRKQKRIAACIMLASRLCFPLMALLPIFSGSQVKLLILLVGLYTAANTISTVSWQAIMGELIPLQYRNKVFAQRNVYSSFVGMGIVLIAGWYIDHYSFPVGYQTAFILGTACGLIECFYFIKLYVPSENAGSSCMDEPAVLSGNPRRATASERLKAFARTFQFQAGSDFYLFCAAAVIFSFTWMMAWPVFTKVKVDMLHATNSQISIDTVAAAIGSLLGFRFWLRIADRKGNALTLFLSALGIACNPLMWIFASSMKAVYIADLLGAFVTAGFTQSLFNRQLELLPPPSRQKAIAFYTTLSQMAAVVAPIFGMKLYEWIDLDAMLVVSSIARTFGALTLLIILLPVVQRFLTRKKNLSA